MRRLTLLHVTDHYPGLHATVGGAERAAERIIAASREAFEVRVAVQPVDTPLPPGVLPVPGFRLRMPARWRGLLTRLAYAGLWNDPGAFRALGELIRTERPDVVHFHNCKLMGSRILELPHRLGIPSVLSVYDYWAFCPLVFLYASTGRTCRARQGWACRHCRLKPRWQAPGLTPAVALARRFLSTRHLARVTRFHALSENSRAVLASMGIPTDRVAVIPQIFEAEGEDVPASPDAPRPLILYAGWMAPHKGLLTVLEAFRRFRETAAGAGYCFVALAMPGDDPGYDDQVRAFVATHGLEGSVRVLGRVGRRDFLGYLAAAAAVVVAEQWENMSPVLLTEAMAHGRAIVAGRIGGIPEFVAHERSALLARHDDPSSYAEMFGRLAADPALGAALGRQARAGYEHTFTRAALQPRYTALYERVVAESRTPH
jgi:glycosyltransferase involved in cell wall biosynthesis